VKTGDEKHGYCPSFDGSASLLPPGRVRLEDPAKGVPVSITINLVSIPVDDQAKALEFYTEKFGFEKRADVSQGDYRWLTVTAPEGSPEIELVLEPNANPASKSYQESLREQGIPITSFLSSDLDADYERLAGEGVTFTMELTDMPWGKFAILDDTCGNLVQLQQVNVNG
jgi:predicted enzyme related to lactoylglutathione lyase